MMTAKRWTAKSLLAAAKKKYGDKVMLRENKSALTASQRESAKSERDELVAAKGKAEEIIKLCNLRQSFDELAEAAQFVVDVNGDHPSVPQLAEALNTAKSVALALDVIRDAGARVRKLSGMMLTRRFSLDEPCGIGLMEHARADTLDELASKLDL